MLADLWRGSEEIYWYRCITPYANNNIRNSWLIETLSNNIERVIITTLSWFEIGRYFIYYLVDAIKYNKRRFISEKNRQVTTHYDKWIVLANNSYSYINIIQRMVSLHKRNKQYRLEMNHTAV